MMVVLFAVIIDVMRVVKRVVMRAAIARYVIVPAVIGAVVPAAQAAPELTVTTPVDTDEMATMMDVSRTPRTVRRSLFAAQAYRDADKLDEAIAVLSKQIADHPGQDHYLIRYQLGYLLAGEGHYAEALPQLEAAVALQPRLYPAWRNLGEAAYEQQDYARAAEAFAQAHALDPDAAPDILYYAAACWLLAERPEQAVPLLRELISGQHGPPQLEWYRGLVSAHLAQEAPARADAAMDSLLARHPADPDAWLLAYQQAAAAGDYREAAVHLTVAGYLRPLTRGEKRQLGDLYAAAGVPIMAARYYAAALADSSSGPAASDWNQDTRSKQQERLAAAYLAAHQPERALAVIENSLAAGPTTRLWSLKGDLHYMREEYEEALAAFGRAVALGDTPDSQGRLLLMMGYCALALDRLDEAAKHLRSATAHPNQAAAARRQLEQIDALRN